MLPPVGLTAEERIAMEGPRKKHMTSSYCYDRTRYRVPPLECVINSREAKEAFGGLILSHSTVVGGITRNTTTGCKQPAGWMLALDEVVAILGENTIMDPIFLG
ncbi:hypothetical protein CRG98_026502 [Punica granatum]|uniref:Xyloglucan endo-transglycosylase C-terminal domain-containing protein n=1 Tax=Punica granatum TaxID=22663 RepID=A0A2I0JA23_PUNGR|nr:hypothetical protein CRG98_026502 [Punica granatum]